MDNYPWRELKLEKAMNMELNFNSMVRMWGTPNFSVIENYLPVLPENAIIRQIFVMKCSNRDQATLGIIWTVKGDLSKIKLDTIDKFSSLEELQKRHPQLFEIDGNLYAFA